MKGRSHLLQYFVLALVACTSAEYLMPESPFNGPSCFGAACPMSSVPVNADKPGVHHSVKCTKGEVFPHHSECQSFYVCNRNGSAIKLACSFGYAFHPRMKFCVPKSLVKSCGPVYCPPSVLIGMVPDTKSCTRYYKCVYGLPMHFECEPGSVYDEELGRCLEYGNEIPSCVSEENNPATTSYPPTTTTTTPAPPITTTDEVIITEEPSIPTTSADGLKKQ